MSSTASARVEFPLSNLSPHNPPSDVQIRQFDFQHDMAVITYYDESHTFNRYRNGSPVRVTYGAFPRIETFVGYVLYAKPLVEPGRYEVRVVCIGATYSLKESGHAIHPDASVEQVVRQEAFDSGFALVRDRSTVQFSALSRHSKETLWEYLVRMAKRQGYTFFGNRTTLSFYDPVPLLNVNTQSLPYLTYAGRQGEPGDLISFRAALSEDGAGKLTNHDVKLFALDPRNASVIYAHDDGATHQRLNPVHAQPRYGKYMDVPAHTLQEAQARVTGQKKSERWVSEAKATARGNARVHQGSAVVVHGVSHQDDGVWYVHGVSHIFTSEGHPGTFTYNMDLDLRRDSRVSNGTPRSAPRAIRPLTNVSQRTLQRPAVPLLQGSTWRSPQLTETVVDV